jgi:hypothetical protein
MFLPTMCSLLGYHLFSQKVLKIPAAASPAFSVSCLILIIYGFSLFQQMPLILAISWYVGLILLPLTMFYSKRRDDTFTIMIFIALGCIFYMGLSGLYFERWDEFSFWGTVSKAIYLDQRLPDHATNIGFKDYPLANALFQNWFYYGLGGFKEGYAYVAQAILLFVPLLIVSELRPKLQALIALCACCIGLSFFNPGMLSSLYVDTVLATTFAGSLMGYVLLSHRYRVLIFLPSVLLLPLIKQAGLMLALLSACVFISVEFAAYRAEKKPGHGWPLIFAMLLLPLGILLVHYSWIYHVQMIQGGRTFKLAGINFSRIMEGLFAGDALAHKIREKFFYAWLQKGKELNRLHIATPFLLIGFLGCWFKIRAKIANVKELQKIDRIYGLLLVGYVIFTLGLLLLYLFSYSPYEALNLASFARYLGIFLLAMYLFCMAVVFKYTRLSCSKRAWYGHSLLIILTCTGLLFSKKPGMLPFRQEQQQIAAQILAKDIAQKAKIYLIVQDNIMHSYMYRYSLWPRWISDCNSIVPLEKYKSDIPGYCILTKAQWHDRLKNYDYLLIAHADDTFWRFYANTFPGFIRPRDTKMSFWKIRKQASKLTLIRWL